MTYPILRVILCCCLALLVTVTESRQPESIAEEWQGIYRTLFEPAGTKWNGERLSDHVMFLHTRIDHVRQVPSVTQNMIDNAEYMYELLTDINTDHCTSAHLDSVRERFKQIRSKLDGNLEELFKLTHQNLVEICGVLHENAVSYLDELFDKKIRWWLKETSQLFYNKYYSQNTKVTDDYFLQGLYAILGLGRFYTDEEYREAWLTRGPCKKLESALERGGFKKFSDFSEFNGYNGYTLAHSCQPSIRDWALAIYRCHRLDKPMLELHKKEPKQPGRFMSFFRSGSPKNSTRGGFFGKIRALV